MKKETFFQAYVWSKPQSHNLVKIPKNLSVSWNALCIFLAGSFTKNQKAPVKEYTFQ